MTSPVEQFQHNSQRPSRSALSACQGRMFEFGPMYDFETWVEDRMRKAYAQWRSKLMADLCCDDSIKGSQKFNCNTRNRKGETLMIGVVRYITSLPLQVNYLRILNDLGADPNAGDKHGRTPLMFACMERKATVALYLVENIDYRILDRNGNTTLMYCATYGQKDVLAAITAMLTRSWSIDAFKVRNVMGNTAERMASLGGHEECAKILDSKRISLLNRMYKQLALLNASAQARGWRSINWRPYSNAFKAAKSWRKRTQSALSSSDLDLQKQVSTAKPPLTAQWSSSSQRNIAETKVMSLSINLPVLTVDHINRPVTVIPLQSSKLSKMETVSLPKIANKKLSSAY